MEVKRSLWKSITSRNPRKSGASSREYNTQHERLTTLSSHNVHNQEVFHANQHLEIATPLPRRSRSRDRTRSGPNKYGLFRLDDTSRQSGVHSGKQYPVDIIAVHGMNGDAFNTWTAEAGKIEQVNWLEDFLPKEFPGARIYTFGYEADLIWTRGTGDISSHARDLMARLIPERVERDQKRPIIFICHSMGGIIVKKALNLCAHENEAHHEIRDSVKAILFFATPHRGSALASIAGDLARLSNALSLGRAIKTETLRALERDSRILQEITLDFRLLTPKYELYSFQEMSRTKYLNKLVVSQADATLGAATEVPVPMAGHDHRSIVRFRDERDQDYSLVKGMLRQAVSNALKR